MYFSVGWPAVSSGITTQKAVHCTGVFEDESPFLLTIQSLTSFVHQSFTPRIFLEGKRIAVIETSEDSKLGQRGLKRSRNCPPDKALGLYFLEEKKRHLEANKQMTKTKNEAGNWSPIYAPCKGLPRGVFSRAPAARDSCPISFSNDKSWCNHRR
ncbi:hypothetical protein JTE90_014647 [Oedothorax gibbosus]|uniref:Uncharacterized protein n=1 Tax=Oedothorax gibbosus TaxID=931172 RepID=A0AAV6VB15_9ARAC|nr:hypothetical protein JTE90_014647 [Oedothorax gibbosus]